MFFYESDISNPDMYFLKISFFWCPDIRFYRFSIHKTFQESMAELTDSAQYTIYLSILAHNSGSFTFSKLIHSPNNNMNEFSSRLFDFFKYKSSVPNADELEIFCRWSFFIWRLFQDSLQKRPSTEKKTSLSASGTELL